MNGIHSEECSGLSVPELPTYNEFVTERANYIKDMKEAEEMALDSFDVSSLDSFDDVTQAN